MRKKIQYARIDSDGFYVEPVLFDEGVIPVDEDVVIVDVQEGLYKPRWDGEAWVEGLTQAEIDARTGNTLEQLKVKKMEEIWTACNTEILSGFLSSATGEELLYGFDEEDQKNLTGVLTLMNANPSLTQVDWKPKGVAPFPHTKEQMVQICADAFVHKQTNINKYWTLRDQVESSTVAADIINIGW